VPVCEIRTFRVPGKVRNSQVVGHRRQCALPGAQEQQFAADEPRMTRGAGKSRARPGAGRDAGDRRSSTRDPAARWPDARPGDPARQMTRFRPDDPSADASSGR